VKNVLSCFSNPSGNQSVVSAGGGGVGGVSECLNLVNDSQIPASVIQLVLPNPLQY
jgi:hypothetical protein